MSRDYQKKMVIDSLAPSPFLKHDSPVGTSSREGFDGRQKSRDPNGHRIDMVEIPGS